MLKALVAPMVLDEKSPADGRCGGDGKLGGALLDLQVNEDINQSINTYCLGAGRSPGAGTPAAGGDPSAVRLLPTSCVGRTPFFNVGSQHRSHCLGSSAAAGCRLSTKAAGRPPIVADCQPVDCI